MAQSTPDMYVGLKKKAEQLIERVNLIIGEKGVIQAVYYCDELISNYRDVCAAIADLDRAIYGLKTETSRIAYQKQRSDLLECQNKLESLILKCMGGKYPSIE